MTRPLRQDASKRRTALLDAAASVFAEEGLDAPLEMIAERAGVGRATLYRNFPDREALAYAVLGESIARLAEWAAERAGMPGLFFDFLARLAEQQIRNAGLATALRRISSAEVFATLRQRLAEAGAPALRAAQSSGEVRGDLVAMDIPTIAVMLGAAIQAEAVADRPARMRTVLDILLAGVRAR